MKRCFMTHDEYEEEDMIKMPIELQDLGLDDDGEYHGGVPYLSLEGAKDMVEILKEALKNLEKAIERK